MVSAMMTSDTHYLCHMAGQDRVEPSKRPASQSTHTHKCIVEFFQVWKNYRTFLPLTDRSLDLLQNKQVDHKSFNSRWCFETFYFLSVFDVVSRWASWPAAVSSVSAFQWRVYFCLLTYIALPTFRRVSPNFCKHFHPGYLSAPINTSRSRRSRANANAKSSGRIQVLVFHDQNG
jgi:hypothetical protein